MFTHAETPAHWDHVRQAYAYDAMLDMAHLAPRDARVVAASYQTFKSVLLAQWRTLSPLYTFEAWQGGEDSAYADSASMRADVTDNRHLWVYPTDETQMDMGHPMAEPLPEQDQLPGLVLFNDAFRGVHDILGHVVSGGSFGVNGETRAWLAHRRTFPAQALPALWCETRGQAAWTNAYGEHATLPLAERPFAEQKAGMPPVWAV